LNYFSLTFSFGSYCQFNLAYFSWFLTKTLMKTLTSLSYTVFMYINTYLPIHSHNRVKHNYISGKYHWKNLLNNSLLRRCHSCYLYKKKTIWNNTYNIVSRLKKIYFASLYKEKYKIHWHWGVYKGTRRFHLSFIFQKHLEVVTKMIFVVYSYLQNLVFM